MGSKICSKTVTDHRNPESQRDLTKLIDEPLLQKLRFVNEDTINAFQVNFQKVCLSCDEKIRLHLQACSRFDVIFSKPGVELGAKKQNLFSLLPVVVSHRQQIQGFCTPYGSLTKPKFFFPLAVVWNPRPPIPGFCTPYGSITKI